MKKYLFICIMVNRCLLTRGQDARYPFKQLYELGSIGNSNSPARYFGNLYFHFLESIENQLGPTDSLKTNLVRRFEKIFAQFYVDAYIAHQNDQSITPSEWKAYFFKLFSSIYTI
jgi:hypothetical protein